MTRRLLLTGPDHAVLEDRAFEWANDHAAATPESVLYLTRYDARRSIVADRWAERYAPLQLCVANLSGIVADCYEQLVGPSTALSGALNRRVVEQALDTVATEAHADGIRFERAPVSAGLADAFETRFSLFGDVGFTTSDDLDTELGASALDPTVVDLVTETYDRYHELRATHAPEWTHTGGEAYETVLNATQPLETLLPNVDVVVLSGYHELRPMEARVIERLAATFPVVAILPRHGDDEAGVAPATADARTTFEELGFDEQPVPPETPTRLQCAAGALYRSDRAAVSAPEALTWRELPTPERELQFVARDLRKALAAGTEPSELTVVVPRLNEYRAALIDTFDAYEIPYTLATPRPLEQTLVGNVVIDVLTLADRPHVDDLLTLISNPLVTAIPTFAERALRAARSRRDTSALEAIVPDLDATAREPLDALLTTIARLDAAEMSEALAALDDLFDELGVSEALAARTADAPSSVEARARSRVTEILDSLDQVDASTPVTPLERLQRAFEGVPVRVPPRHTAGQVEVVGFLDAQMRSLDHVYLVGLTAENFPNVVQRPAFFERMTEAVPRLDPGDERVRTRYLFATLLANAQAVTLTTPAVGDGESAVVHSPIVAELARVTGLEPETGVDGRIASREDLQRALATHPNPAASLETARGSDAETFTPVEATRARRGITCATNRCGPNVGPHDGVLDPATVAAIYSDDDRTPYSVSRVERYVSCGFRFYMEQILEITTPDDIERTPTPLETGSYVHTVLERFYADLQTDPAAGVDLDGHATTELETHLLEIALDELEAADFQYDGLFYRYWLEQLFAGLAAEANPHTGGNRPHAGEERGLFVRFLETEQQRTGPLRPQRFEAPFGAGLPDSGPDDAFEIELPNGRSFPLRGYIDRIDVAAGSDDRLEMHLYDYKTGSIPYMTAVTGGTKFQLPVYLLAADALIDDPIEAIDATYYQVKPPNNLKTPRGISSKFDSPAELHQFLGEVVPERLATIQNAIEGGRFHTTLLSKGAASCGYCDYRHVCEVQAHEKSQRIERLTDDAEAYVPERVQTDSLDVMGDD